MAYTGLGGGDAGSTGYYKPQLGAATSPAPTSTPGVNYSGNQPGLWYDPSKYDPNNRLSAINTLSGLQFNDATPGRYTPRGDSGDEWTDGERAYVQSSNGTKLYLNGDANQGYTFSDRYNDPTGKSEKDQMGVTYSYDPKTGTAKPISADPFYQPSDWVNTYRDVLTYLAPVVTAGLGGAYFGAAGEVGGGGEAVSGMDLAADAGAASGNNVAYAGGQLGAEGGSTASLGSDAHFYQPQSGGVGVQDLGNMGGAGTATIPSMTLGGGASNYLKDAYDTYKAYKGVAGAVSGGSGASSSGSTGGNSSRGLSAGDRFRQQLSAQALRDQVQQPTQAMPGWISGG